MSKNYEKEVKLLEYTPDVQKLFLRMMLTNAVLYVRVANIMNPANFDKSLRPVAEMFVEHSKKYNVLPDRTQIMATTGIDIEPIPELTDGHGEWFLDEFESFTRRQEVERAVFKSADLLEKGGDFGPIFTLIKTAVQISLQKDLGTDYFADPRARLLALKSNNGQNSTGWKSMDRALYGGFNRGELQIFAGGSGSGKSLFMQNLAVNWIEAGLSGVYITLELSEGLSSMRIDSMTTGTSSKDIFKDLDNVEMKVKMKSKKSGAFHIKYMPAQSNVNDIRAYCKELQIKSGIKIDFLCIDYLDLLMPVGVKVSPENLFVKDKYVTEEMRNLSEELNVLFVTASQLNRAAVDEIEFDHSHISGGISKINTADNVFGIFTSRSMREKGRYQLQLMKTRSSSGIGQKIELDFNVETLRITDPDDFDDAAPVRQAAPAPQQPSAIDILTNSKPTYYTDVSQFAEEPSKHVVVDVQGAKLKAILNSLKN